MMRLLRNCLFLLFAGVLAAQQYGYEWIDDSKDYIRITTHQDGMYYMLKSDLTASGMPSLTDPRTLRLHHRGVEQFIYISNESSGTFGTNDTLYFYGKRNDGVLDSILYKPYTNQPHRYVNIHSDTCVYFLSWGGTFSLNRATAPSLSPVGSITYHYQTLSKVFVNEFSRGREFGENKRSYFDQGEGWTSTFFDNQRTETFTGIENVHTSGPTAELEIIVTGRNNYYLERIVIVRLGDPNAPSFVDTIKGFVNHGTGKATFSVPTSVLSGSSLNVTLIPYTNPLAVNITNVISVSSMILRYPQQASSSYSNSKTVSFKGVASDVSYQLGWSGSNVHGFDISNPDSLKLVPLTLSAGTASGSLRSGIKKVWIGTRDQFKAPHRISPVTFTLPDSTAVYNIISNAFLRAGTQEYVNYRSSVAGGNYTVSNMEVHKLYDLFAYGEFTPLAIHRYCNYLTDKNENARFLFLVGKALDITFGKWEGYVQYYRWQPEVFHTHPEETFNLRNLVPTAGTPASDIYYVMNSSNNPQLAVGRISSKNNEQLIDYLDKVREHEGTLDSNYLWRKHLVHLSGGADLAQVQSFLGYVNTFKATAENSLWGGKVIRTISKNLNDGTVSKISINEEVNAGVSYVTFYGHSAATVTDLDIGYASQDVYGYRNKGKYPMLVINGCNSASTYYNYSLAEDWLNTPERGAILVLGVSDIGYTYPLYNYTNGLYSNLFNKPENFGMPAGEVIKTMLNDPGFVIDEFTETQMNLQGDPAIVIYSPRKTDYEISGDEQDRDDDPEQKVFIKTPDGSKLTAAMPNFQIGIPIKNFGVYDKDSFNIFVRRIVNGKTTTYPFHPTGAIRYMDTVYFDITGNNKIEFFGLNRFEIFADYTDSIHEMREDNNFATINYFMPISAVTCLFPKEFSIVHDETITFIAQSTDLMIEQADYFIELDTAYKYNSPLHRSSVISSSALMKWVDQTLPRLVDSTVYFWRVRLNTIPVGQDTSWSSSSFIYIDNSPDGWSQAHPGQFPKDEIKTLDLDIPQNKWTFSPSSQHLFTRCYGNPVLTDVLGNDSSDINDRTDLSVGPYRLLFPGYWYLHCQEGYRPNYGENTSTEFDGMYAVAFDKSTLEPFLSMPFWKCGRIPFVYVYQHVNLADLGNRNYFVKWINSVPEGYIVMMGNSGNAFYDQWGDKTTDSTLRHAIYTNFGATKLDDLNDNEPYILLAVKGGAPLSEKHTDDKTGVVALDTTITSRYNNGSLYSTLIGPSKEWGTYYKRVDSLDGSDRSIFGLVRYRLDGTSDTLNNLSFNPNVDNIDTLDLAPMIDANQYPYIKLFVLKHDSATVLTPPQMKKWQVIYKRAPEGTMNPFAAGLEQYSTGGKREQGTSICYSYVFENISDLPFDDTLRATASVISLYGQKDTTFMVKPDTLDPGETFTFNHCFNTSVAGGSTTFRMFVNPRIQPEEYYNNNVIETTAEVDRDRTPPVIDVTFDGVHIMDGDLVSPSPIITITLNDNSKFLLMSDPTKVSLYLKRPGSTSEETILSSHPDILRFGQDGGSNNTFTIEYNPKNLPDGKYSIIVQGTDVNGNKSGKLYYVNFEVVNASTISNVFPYPNPFSSSTQFVFTLTGSEIPEDMKIQIMTVTGKVVREITKAELGPLHIGNNRTQYAWDGKDEFGDKLANGVYLYRVMIKNKGDNFEHRETAGDKSFKKEFGKIYILR